MYVYSTPTFDRQVKKYGLEGSVSKLRDRLKTYDVRLIFDSIGEYYKRREGKVRLIGSVRLVSGDEVFCFLDVLERKGSSYKDFLNDTVGYGTKFLDGLLDSGMLAEFLRETKRNEQPRRKPLPDDLRLWFEPPQWGTEINSEDLVIYESEEWVKRFRRPEVQTYWETYHRIILSILSDTPNHQDIPDWSGLKIAGENGRYVLFFHAEIDQADNTSRKSFFLIAPFDHNPMAEEILGTASATNLRYGVKTRNGEVARLNSNELAQYAQRTYPGYMLLDEESWLAIEREEEANLALSAEEELVLKSVSLPTKGEPSLPIFINGRAGSGKSTMLLYLFADYCYRKTLRNLTGTPLFLTYNERLLDVAREGVRKILTSHYRFIEAKSIADEPLSVINSFFQPFQKFLLNLLPPEKRAEFVPERYVSFHQFKRLYNGDAHNESPQNQIERESLARERKIALKLPEADMWSPELCWHVIRTFIKGYRIDDYVALEDYEEISRREKTIPEDTFSDIFETIWSQWYKPLTEDEGYWDDQDLIRTVLELQCARPDYTAIFCDEAQDFTRIELKLVMQMSVFSLYDLGYQPIYSLPFAFAGDPFQTLNPTGFSWSSMQSAFFEEVITVLDPAKTRGLGMNFQELTFNYRSTPSIVRATNVIQLWRRVLFNLRDLKPQRWWQKNESPDPLKFIIGKDISSDELKKVIQNTILIVPCEEGQEISYIQQDPVLHLIFRELSSKEPPKNVLSAITAKGLEFKRVILYKFGEHCDDSVWNLLKHHDPHPVKYEYFFNKLYVAASRAMERLFIVDTLQGDEKLWRRASSQLEIEALLGKVNSQDVWRDNIQTISTGTLEDASGMYEDDLLYNAQQFERKGLHLRSAQHLRRAKQYYSSMGHDSEAARCEAQALRLEHRFSEASTLFEKLGKADEAGNCLWEGMLWQQLLEWSQQHPGRMSDEAKLATFMAADIADTEAIKDFSLFLEKNIRKDRKSIGYRLQWRETLKEYLMRLSALAPSQLKQNEWQLAGSVLDECGDIAYSEFYHEAGFCFFKGTNFIQAVKCWTKCGETDHTEYYLAQSKIDSSNMVNWLEKAGAHQEIINQWKKAGALNALGELNWPKYIETAIERTKSYDDLLGEWENSGGLEVRYPQQWLRVIGGL